MVVSFTFSMLTPLSAGPTVPCNMSILTKDKRCLLAGSVCFLLEPKTTSPGVGRVYSRLGHPPQFVNKETGLSTACIGIFSTEVPSPLNTVVHNNHTDAKLASALIIHGTHRWKDYENVVECCIGAQKCKILKYYYYKTKCEHTALLRVKAYNLGTLYIQLAT